MNSLEIQCILSCYAKTKKIFRGVYPSDMLPAVIKNYPSAFVVNLSPSCERGTHWIAIYLDGKKCCYYFDSFGFPPNNPSIEKFIRKNSTSQVISMAELQSTNSTVCGAYAICFIIFHTNNNDGKCGFYELFTCNPFINDICIQKTLDKIKQEIYCQK